jgi:ribosomal protein S18 acetylase RimI-like enzyme
MNRKDLSTLHPDPWLSEQLCRPCFRYDSSERGPRGLRELLAGIPESRAFVFARLSCAQTDESILLQDAGFRIVDVNLTLVKKISKRFPTGFEIREAVPEDEEAVAGIAGSAYRFSRFHLDPAFEKTKADTLKRAWVQNFFRGKRGDKLLVALREGRPAGFLLALKKPESCVIDLIAVSEDSQRSGIGSALIAACESAFEGADEISAGTQAANIASMRLYERLGFRLRSSQFILHWHK